MSCGHGYGHGYGHGHHSRCGEDWYRGECWPDDVDPRVGWRERPRRITEDASSVEETEARIAGLHRAIRRIEAELAELRVIGVPAGSGTTRRAPASGPDAPMKQA